MKAEEIDPKLMFHRMYRLFGGKGAARRLEIDAQQKLENQIHSTDTMIFELALNNNVHSVN